MILRMTAKHSITRQLSVTDSRSVVEVQASINTTTTNFNQILAYSNVFGDYHHLSAGSVMNTISMNTTILTDRKQTF